MRDHCLIQLGHDTHQHMTAADYGDEVDHEVDILTCLVQLAELAVARQLPELPTIFTLMRERLERLDEDTSCCRVGMLQASHHEHHLASQVGTHQHPPGEVEAAVETLCR
jgi:hypothetical protein